jgi:hypothetical protein
MKTVKFLSVLAALCIFIPSFALAGAGVEPGAGCPAPPGDRLGYVPPPFIGEVTLTFNPDQGTISANGVITQVGNPECDLTVHANPYIGSVTSEDWDIMKPNDLRARCLEEVEFTVGVSCEQIFQVLVFYEAVGAGHIQPLNSLNKTANFVVMGLE